MWIFCGVCTVIVANLAIRWCYCKEIDILVDEKGKGSMEAL